MRNRIINALIELGLPANVKGFKYIVEIVNEYAKDESLMSGKLEVLYYMLGKKKKHHHKWLKEILELRLALYTKREIKKLSTSIYHFESEQMGIRLRHYI